MKSRYGRKWPKEKSDLMEFAKTQFILPNCRHSVRGFHYVLAYMEESFYCMEIS